MKIISYISIESWIFWKIFSLYKQKICNFSFNSTTGVTLTNRKASKKLICWHTNAAPRAGCWDSFGCTAAQHWESSNFWSHGIDTWDLSGRCYAPKGTSWGCMKKNFPLMEKKSSIFNTKNHESNIHYSYIHSSKNIISENISEKNQTFSPQLQPGNEWRNHIEIEFQCSLPCGHPET